MRIDLLLLALTVLSALLLDLVVKRKEHLVTVFLVLDLLLADHLRVLKLQELVTRFQQLLHLLGLIVKLCLVSLGHLDGLRFKSKQRSSLEASHNLFEHSHKVNATKCATNETKNHSLTCP